MRASDNTLLDGSSRYPIAGRVRPGIKIPTPKARAVPAMLKAYNDGVAAGAFYDDINKAMLAAGGKNFQQRSALMPSNASYFRVNPDDYTMPGAAQKIMDMYGEVRGDDPEKRLYSFPVVFPTNDIDAVFEEKFEAWAANQIRFWEQDGKCMKIQDSKPDKSKRRRWGPRAHEQVRDCDPNNCEEFGKGHCMHSAKLRFWIPGIAGAGVIELAFKSVYASLGIEEMLRTVQGGIGRIDGMLDGKPIFRISKVVREVSMMNWETGKPKRVKQDIISIEADLDMTQPITNTPVAGLIEAPKEMPEYGPTDDEDKEPSVRESIAEQEAADKRAAEAEAESLKMAAEAKAVQEAEDKERQLVKQLRGNLADEMRRVEMDVDGLIKWMGENDYAEDDAHSSEKLLEMLGLLEKVPERKADEDETPPLELEGESELEDDDQVPF